MASPEPKSILQEEKHTISDVYIHYMASGSNVSTRTVHQELHEMGFHGRAATYKPKVTMHNAKCWLVWCKARCQWTLEQ
jgi:hypothetical protein